MSALGSCCNRMIGWYSERVAVSQPSWGAAKGVRRLDRDNNNATFQARLPSAKGVGVSPDTDPKAWGQCALRLAQAFGFGVGR